MSTRLERAVQAAKNAIDAVFNDSSVPQAATLAALRELVHYIQDMAETLDPEDEAPRV